MSATSAGILLYRLTGSTLEVFIAHPGGRVWKNRDIGAWTIPKGSVERGEDLLGTAKREFCEETGFDALGPFIPLGKIRQKSGEVVHAWAWEGDLDETQAFSNYIDLESPRGSGRYITIPEIDRYGWFDAPTAREKLNPAQAAFVDRLERMLASAIGDR